MIDTQYLAADEQLWIPIAQAVIKGEYNKANYSTLTSIEIGLRSIKHPVCQRALELLKLIEKKPTV